VTANSTPSPPPLFRFLLWIGKPFGLYYVPENHARLVRRMEQYHRVERGPGFFRYNTLTETLGAQIKVGVEAFSFQFDNLPSKDGLQLGLRLAINYDFAPEKTRLTTAAKLGGFPKDVFCDIVANRVRRSLLAILPAFTAEEACRGQAFDNIEKQLVINANSLLEPLGIAITGPLILQVIPPDALRARFEGVAQRRINVEALREHRSTDVGRALAAELIEGLSSHGAGEQLVSLGDLLNVYGQPDQTPPPPLPAPARGSEPKPERKSFLTPPRKK